MGEPESLKDGSICPILEHYREEVASEIDSVHGDSEMQRTRQDPLRDGMGEFFSLPGKGARCQQ